VIFLEPKILNVRDLDDGVVIRYDYARNYQKEMKRKNQEEQAKKGASEDSKKPPFDGRDLGNDPAKCPEEGFEWRGKDIQTGEGNWYNPNTGISLHPDLDHPLPTKPHWDYNYPGGGKGQRINTDGTWEEKL